MKRILIISYMMNSGGVEVSLLNFIKKLKERDDIYLKLLVLKKEGVYTENFKKIIEIDEVEFVDTVYNLAIPYNKEKKLIKKFQKITLKALNKYNYKNVNKHIIKYTKNYKENWDMAIDFHGYGYVGTAYLALKINSKIKISFIHDEKINWMKKNEFIMEKIDYYFAVSNACANILKNKYPMISKKVKVFRNVLDKNKIIELSKKRIQDSFDGDFKLLTVGRLEKQKGYNILINTAMKLKESNIDFKWYVIGTGTLEKSIKHKIQRYNLKDNVILLGMKKNPYPYIKNCDIYVQPSIHEGYGIAIAEARILNKIIIASDLPCIEEQITDKHNGVLCKIEPSEFYENIVKIKNDENFKKIILNNLYNEDNEDDIQYIYELLEG